ncbi:MAG: ATP-binding protein [Nitrosopumilus sp.]|nr:ATP-binding protein [Nitrosopumilus sp.]
MNINTQTITETIATKICKKVLELEEDIRFIGIISEKGKLLSYKYSSKITPLLSQKETELSALEAFNRFEARTANQQKIGPPIYTVTNYGDIKRATLFIENMGLLLLSFDKNKDEYLLLDKIFFYFRRENLSFNSKNLEALNQFVERKINQEKFSTLGELTASFAHDFRNPLSVISASMHFLKSSYGANEKQEKVFDRVQRAISRISYQMEDILYFAKEQNLQLKNTKFSEIIKESLDSLIIPNYIKIIVPKNDIKLQCDVNQLARALTNLILNGIQSINDAGIVEISVEKNNAIIIQVKDSGSGITEKNLESIFDPLFSTKQGGTGLGLSIVKSIINSHGGTISVTSPPTVFRITLPKTLD